MGQDSRPIARGRLLRVRTASFRLRFLIAALILTWASLAPAKADRFRKARTLIQQQVEQGRVPSVAVAVARRGEIVWEEAFGWVDREQGIPATIHTMYSLASVSKPLTATGLMVLVEQGAVDLDRPINHQLGEVHVRVRVGDPNGATVRQVANHTSGLPLHHHFFADATTRPPLEETIHRYGNLVTEPGKRYQYSNLGYAVLERLIEHTSGVSYARFMSEKVFGPLGLEHTAVLQAPQASDDLAVRYRLNGQSLPFYGSDHGGGSAAFACVHDLVRFGIFHLQTRLADQSPILSGSTIRTMQEPSADQGDGSHYGIGWVISQHKRHAVVRHDGGMPGVTATLMLLPAAKIAVAVVCNTKSDLPRRVAAEIVAALRPHGLPGRRVGRPFSAEVRRKPPRRLVGTWIGHIDIGQELVPVTLSVKRPKALWAQIGDPPARGKLSGVNYSDGHLTGWTKARLRSDRGEPARMLRLSLEFREDQLSGAVTEFFRSAEGLPNALSYWADLERCGPEPAD